MGYIKGGERAQSILFPESIDDYIGEDNSVLVIEEYVDHNSDLAEICNKNPTAQEIEKRVQWLKNRKTKYEAGSVTLN